MVQDIINKILRDGCFEHIAPHKSKNEKRIMVAMSGGVDSSVVAAILHHAGYNVVGVTMRLYSIDPSKAKKGACCAGIDIYDAKRVAQQLGFPHYVVNYEEVFKKKVIDYFVEEYVEGRTPIPCTKCNEDIKFDELIKNAQNIDCDALVTGHYVKKIFKNGEFELHQGDDENKDQSYFLFTTTKEQLKYTCFPLGGTTKNETRQIAEYYKLITAKKRESQDICFVTDSYKDIVKKFSNDYSPGDIVNTDGEKIGKHTGIINYTIGQRKGIEISMPYPIYVIKIDKEKNQIVVGTKEHLMQDKFRIQNTNILSSLTGKKLSVKIRSRKTKVNAQIKYINHDIIECTLEELEIGICPGQACVFYDNSQLLGGGWIL